MKKLFAITAVILAISLILCACGSSEPLSKIFETIKSEVGVSDLVEFSSVSDLDRFYGIAADDVEEFAGGINNSGVDQEEIVLIKAANNDAASRIETALNNRLNSKLNETKNYNPEQYAIVEKCSVDADGLYVSMIISKNASAIKEIYKKAIGA